MFQIQSGKEMADKENYEQLPMDLLKQVEEICKSFKQIQSEASGIIDQTKMPDNTAHLNDVLNSTEEATTIIIDSATAILTAIGQPAPEAMQQEVTAHVTKIYEACNFQDITGQRIKKVLKSLGQLEERLQNLAKAAKTSATGGPDAAPANDKDDLLNGPQLSGAAPSQADIDKLFGSL